MIYLIGTSFCMVAILFYYHSVCLFRVCMCACVCVCACLCVEACMSHVCGMHEGRGHLSGVYYPLPCGSRVELRSSGPCADTSAGWTAGLLFLRWDLPIYQASLYLQWLSHPLLSGAFTGDSRIPFQSSCWVFKPREPMQKEMHIVLCWEAHIWWCR